MIFKEWNHKRRAIYIHIPKVAGISIESALVGSKVGHSRALDYLAEDAEAFNNYFSFAFVRSPYTRLASAYFFLCSGGRNLHDKAWAKLNLSSVKSFEEFVMSLQNEKFRLKILQGIHFCPQYRFVCNENGNIIVDFIGRFESLEQDFLRVCSRLGVLANLSHKNRTAGKLGYLRLYTDEMASVVRNIYKKDFELFKYKAELVL